MPKKGEHLGNETKEKIRKARLGKSHSKETRDKLATTRRRLFAEGKLKVWNKNKHDIYTSETRRKISEGAKRSWKNFKYRERLGKIRSKMLSKKWADKDFYNRMYPILIKNNENGRKNAVIIEKKRETMKKLWASKGYVDKIKASLKLKPSAPELYLDAILQLNFKNQWKYTGDFQFWIEGKNPDFVNINGKKLLIEYNGYTLTHTPKRDKEKEEHYAKYGYKTLNLYPEDLENEVELIQKIKDYHAV